MSSYLLDYVNRLGGIGRNVSIFHRFYSIFFPVFCLFGVYILYKASVQVFLENNMNTTTTIGDIPFWSRGFARSCCDIYPNVFGKLKGGFFESGEVFDSKYFFQKPILSGDIVYVVTSDFPRFLDVFVKLNEVKEKNLLFVTIFHFVITIVIAISSISNNR
jgi:hypothetical protein